MSPIVNRCHTFVFIHQTFVRSQYGTLQKHKNKKQRKKTGEYLHFEAEIDSHYENA